MENFFYIVGYCTCLFCILVVSLFAVILIVKYFRNLNATRSQAAALPQRGEATARRAAAWTKEAERLQQMIEFLEQKEKESQHDLNT